MQGSNTQAYFIRAAICKYKSFMTLTASAFFNEKWRNALDEINYISQKSQNRKTEFFKKVLETFFFTFFIKAGFSPA
jgi:hypothetical protein